ncbi:hypothetical protein N475_13985 [Pseudoalteromonas luteoviolacea DSM 6061]|uniref:Uncharacterized protein n=1 Tax=Pseudoalteromonas luteoviolacea DSM 6061 TaxID=1365250 RepID=A0A166XAD8_9GAMM|nr:hypothetical protein N475_13985 [Pseudoalteromonas luteoviolacea DSM 6061]
MVIGTIAIKAAHTYPGEHRILDGMDLLQADWLAGQN